MTTIPITHWRESSFHVNVTRRDFEAHEVALIEQAVCDAYGVPKRKLLHQRTRRYAIAWPRQVCMFILQEALGMSQQDAADHFGLTDRSTAAHAVMAVQDRMATCPREKAKINELLVKFNGKE
jgi:chromosomal replication initiation ATPase DnaA